MVVNPQAIELSETSLPEFVTAVPKRRSRTSWTIPSSQTSGSRDTDPLATAAVRFRANMEQSKAVMKSN
jgi:hypothetical protein